MKKKNDLHQYVVPLHIVMIAQAWLTRLASPEEVTQVEAVIVGVTTKRCWQILMKYSRYENEDKKGFSCCTRNPDYSQMVQGDEG